MNVFTKIIFWILMVFVALAPIPLGSNREWAWTACAVITSVIGLLWLGSALIKPKSMNKLMPPMIIGFFTLVCGWILAQSQFLFSTPNAWHNPLWAMASDALSVELSSMITVAREDSFTALMRLMSYGLVFFLSFQFGRNRQLAATSFKIIAFTGLAYAIYGLITFWSGEGAILWFKEDAFRADVRSTFINRNSYATYAGLSLLCAIAWFYQSIAIKRSNRVYDMPNSDGLRFEAYFLKTWKPLTALLLMSTALILTHSRGGFISATVGVIVLLLVLNSRQKIGSTRTRVAIGSAIAITVLAFVMTSEVLMERMERIDLDGNGRMMVFEQIADPIKQDHMTGTGYGTFADSFRMYRGDELRSHYDKAHNTYLENIFELGWPAALMLFASIGWLGLICLKGARERGRDWVYPATGLAATTLVAIHATMDFSLQMPAIAILYAAIMGIAVAQSYSSRI